MEEVVRTNERMPDVCFLCLSWQWRQVFINDGKTHSLLVLLRSLLTGGERRLLLRLQPRRMLIEGDTHETPTGLEGGEGAAFKQNFQGWPRSHPLEMIRKTFQRSLKRRMHWWKAGGLGEGAVVGSKRGVHVQCQIKWPRFYSRGPEEPRTM